MRIQQVHMLTRRVGLPIALALVLGACGDPAAPLDQQPRPGRPAMELAPGSNGTYSWPAATGIVTLRQSPTAPPLETYQVSFVAWRRKSSTVTVNYQAVDGQDVGQPFLTLYIPKRGLVAGAGGVPLACGMRTRIPISTATAWWTPPTTRCASSSPSITSQPAAAPGRSTRQRTIRPRRP